MLKRRLSSASERPAKRVQTDEVAARLHRLNLGAPAWAGPFDAADVAASARVAPTPRPSAKRTYSESEPSESDELEQPLKRLHLCEPAERRAEGHGGVDEATTSEPDAMSVEDIEDLDVARQFRAPLAPHNGAPGRWVVAAPVERWLEEERRRRLLYEPREGAIVLYQSPRDFLHDSLVKYVEAERARRRRAREEREAESEPATDVDAVDAMEVEETPR